MLRGSSISSSGRVALVTHALLILATCCAFLVASWAHAGQSDANIGGGILALLIVLLGMPWSLPVLFWGSQSTAILVAIGAALINLAVHLLVWVLVGKRRDGVSD